MHESQRLSVAENQSPADGTSSGREYRSAAALLGLPLIHVAFGSGTRNRYHRRVAVGWIAIGDLAVGVVFAAGAVAVGGIAIGGFSLGVISLAGLAVGGWAGGGLAVGIYAFGGAAIAWKAALGGLAVANEFAVGGRAVAEHANDAIAKAYMDESPFFRTARDASEHSRWLWVLGLLGLLPVWMNRAGANKPR